MASDLYINQPEARPISADLLSRAANIDVLTKVIRWHGLSITVRQMIPFKEVSQLINSVMSNCIIEDGGIFVPEAMDFAMRVNVILRYTNVELPSDIEEQYRIVYGSGLYEEIEAVINQSQIRAIKDTLAICINKS